MPLIWFTFLLQRHVAVGIGNTLFMLPSYSIVASFHLALPFFVLVYSAAVLIFD